MGDNLPESTTSSDGTKYSLPPADGDAELLLLAQYAPPPGTVPSSFGSRKRKRAERRATMICHSWSKTGACKYGSSCKFGHPVNDDERVGDDGEDDKAETDAVGTVEEKVGEGHTSDAAGAAAPSSSAALTSEAHAQLETVVGSGKILDRYFFLRYAPDMGGERGHDACIAVHSNKIVAMLMLSPAHPIRRLGLQVTRVEYGSGRDGCSQAHPLSSVVTSGKNKRGQLYVQPPGVVATLHTACGGVFPIRANVTAGVMEINTRLLSEPGLVTSRPRTEGHLAIFYLKTPKLQALLSSLLPREGYAKLLALRGFPELSAEVATQGRDEAEAMRARPGVDEAGE